MKSSDLKTRYGRVHFIEAAAPKNTLGEQEIIALFDYCLADRLQPSDITKDHKINIGDRVFDLHDIFRFFDENDDLLRMHVIWSFEQYFSKNSDVYLFAANCHAGDGNAKKILSYACVYPVEAINVWLEVNNPELAKNRDLEDYLDVIYKRINPQHGWQITYQSGPVLPPLSASKMLDLIFEQWPYFDYCAKNDVDDADIDPDQPQLLN